MSTSSKRGQWRISKETKESNEEEIWCGAFPDDVVVEILSRLPPQPFFRFKCVSKTWLALSSQASRLNMHLQPTLRGFYYGMSFFSSYVGFTNISGEVDKDRMLSALPHHERLAILDCCNGLLLIKCSKLPLSHPNSPSYFLYVYNPATRKHIAFEWLPEVSSKACYDAISLAFDPQDQSRFHVVCFRCTYSDDGVFANIFLTFSSDSGTWQHGGNLGCDLIISYSTQGTFFSGRVHRVTTRHEIVSVDPVDNSSLVTKFDFPGLSEKGKSEVGQSQGLLHFMFVNEFHRMSIWVSENGDQQNWILKHQLSLEGLYKPDINIILFQRIKLHPGKDVIFVLEEGNGRILSIDLTNGELNGIYTLSFQYNWTFWLYMPCFWV